MRRSTGILIGAIIAATGFRIAVGIIQLNPKENYTETIATSTTVAKHHFQLPATETEIKTCVSILPLKPIKGAVRTIAVRFRSKMLAHDIAACRDCAERKCQTINELEAAQLKQRAVVCYDPLYDGWLENRYKEDRGKTTNPQCPVLINQTILNYVEAELTNE